MARRYPVGINLSAVGTAIGRALKVAYDSAYSRAGICIVVGTFIVDVQQGRAHASAVDAIIHPSIIYKSRHTGCDIGHDSEGTYACLASAVSTAQHNLSAVLAGIHLAGAVSGYACGTGPFERTVTQPI